MEKRAPALAVFAFCALVTAAPPAHATECIGRAACDVYWTADLVFVGRADSARGERSVGAAGSQAATVFVVEEWLRGARVGRRVALETGAGMQCDAYTFIEGERYLIYAARSANGRWRLLPTGARPIKNAGDDLKYIRNAWRQPGPATVWVHATVQSGPSPLSIRPMIGAHVTLASAGRPRAARTDASGLHRFEGLAAGEYQLQIAPFPGANIVDSKSLIVGPKACISAHFSITAVFAPADLVAESDLDRLVYELRGLAAPFPAAADPSTDSTERQRWNIIDRLRRSSPGSVAALTRALNHSDVSLRRNAILTLRFLASGVSSGDAVEKVDILAGVPAIIRALEDPDPFVRAWAADAIAVVDPPAAEATVALSRALSDSHGLVRLSACTALARAGAMSPTVTSALRLLLNDTNDEARRCGIRVLGRAKGL